METKKPTSLHLLRLGVAFLSAFLTLILLVLFLKDAHAQATSLSTDIQTQPSISVSAISATLPVSDTHAGQGSTKTLFFNNTFPGNITVTWHITGSSPFTFTAGAAFGHGERLLTSTVNPWAPVVSYSVEMSDLSYPGVMYRVTQSNGLTTTAVIHYLRDITLPTSYIGVPLDGHIYTNPLTITGKASDGTGSGVGRVDVRILSGTLNWDGNAWITGETWLETGGTTNWSRSWGLPEWESNRIYTVLSRAADHVENTELLGDASSFFYDALSPWSNILVPQDGVCYGGLSVISGTAGDEEGSGIDRVQVGILSSTLSWNGGAWVITETWLEASGTLSWFLSTGLPAWESGHTYTVRSQAIDYGGNVEQPGDSHIFCYDTQLPWSVVSVPQHGAYYSDLSLISGTAGDEGGAGIHHVDVRILSGTLNWDGSNWVSAETWLETSGTITWSLSSNLPACQNDYAYTVRSRATDNLGHEEIPGAGNTFTCDTQLPWSAVSVPQHGAYYSDLSLISGTAGDEGGAGIHHVDVRILSGTLNWDGSNWASIETWLETSGTITWSLSSNLPACQNGCVYTVRSRATDNLGHEEIPGAGNTFTCDTQPPWTTIDVPINGRYYSSLPEIEGRANELEGSGIDFVILRILSGTLNWDGSAWITTETWLETSGVLRWSRSWGLPAWESGHTYVVRSRAVDRAGNLETPGDSNSFTFDTDPPQSVVSFPVDGAYYNHIDAIYGTSSDEPGVGVDWVDVRILSGTLSWDGSAWITGEAWLETDGTLNWSLPSGLPGWEHAHTYTVRSRATDRLGNREVPGEGNTFVYDIQSPVISSPAIGILVNTQAFHVEGLTLFYTNTRGSGTFAVFGNTTDDLAGPDRVTFSPAFGYIPTDDEDPHIYVGIYDMPGGMTESGTITATAYDRAGNTAFQHYFYEPDGLAPTSAAASPSYAASAPITVTWVASDTQSGVFSTALWYKPALTATWSHYQSLQGSSGTFDFTPTEGYGTYFFATTAVDELGNVESLPAQPDTQTIYDPNDPQSAVTWAPERRTTGSITMTWEASSDSPLELLEVRLWYSSTATGWVSTSLVALPSSYEASGVFTFTPPPGDAVYNFATVASTVRRTEATPSGQGDATTIYRLWRVYMPLVLKLWVPWYEYDVHEPNDSPSEAYGPLTSSHSLDSYIWNANDPDDYFYFQPSIATQVQITMTNIPAGSDYDVWVYYHDGEGYQTIAYSNNGGNDDEYLTFLATANETYYIRIHPYIGWSHDPYRLIVRYDESSFHSKSGMQEQ